MNATIKNDRLLYFLQTRIREEVGTPFIETVVDL